MRFLQIRKMARASGSRAETELAGGNSGIGAAFDPLPVRRSNESNCPKQEKRFLGVLECRFHAYGQNEPTLVTHRTARADSAMERPRLRFAEERS